MQVHVTSVQVHQLYTCTVCGPAREGWEKREEQEEQEKRADWDAYERNELEEAKGKAAPDDRKKLRRDRLILRRKGLKSFIEGLPYDRIWSD